MEIVRQFIWLTGKLPDIPIYAWPITVMVTAVWLAALLINNPFIPAKKYKRQYLLMLTPFALTFLLPVLGMILNNTSTIQRPWPEYLVVFIALLQLPLAGYLIWRFKGFRFFAAATCLFQIWCSCSAMCVAIMSVSCDWSYLIF